jgi:hypothetical protein
MKSALIVLAVLLATVPAMGASKMEAGLGAGYNITSGDDTLTTKGGLGFSGHFYVDPGFVNGLSLGLQVGYIQAGKVDGLAAAGITQSTKETAIPILAVGKYNFMNNGYALLGAGMSSVKTSTTLTFDATVPAAAQTIAQAMADASATSATKFTAMLGAGYAFDVATNFTIDPRAQFYMVFADGSKIKMIEPTLNFVYHF